MFHHVSAGDRQRGTPIVSDPISTDGHQTGHPPVVVIGAPEIAEALEDTLDVPVEAVEDDTSLREQKSSITCAVVDDVPPRGLATAIDGPVIAYTTAEPEEVAGAVDDYVRRNGEHAEAQLVDRVRWACETSAHNREFDQRPKVEQLHDIATELLACRDETGVYELVVSAAERILQFDMCGVDAVEDGWLVPKAVSAQMAEVGYQRSPVDDAGVAGKAVQTGESFIIDDAIESDVADPVEAEYRSGVTVPIGEDTVFQAAARDPRAFDKSDLELAELLAAHAEGTLHRIRSERVVRRRRETIERLHAIATRLMTSESERQLCELLVEAAERLLDFRASAALTNSVSNDRLWVRASSDDELAPPIDYPVDIEGLVGHTFTTGESILVDDIKASELADPCDERYRSGLSVPMGDIGVFQAISTEVGAFDESDLELAELLVAQAGVVARRLRAERRLVGERDRLVALFKNIPDPAVSTTFVDGQPIVRDVNDAFEETFAYDADEAAGKPIDDLVVPEEAFDEAADLNERVRQGETARETVRRRTADGELRDFLVHLVPVQGEPIPVVFAIYTDITDRRRRERAVTELHQATRRLVSADDRQEVAEITTQAAREVLGFALSAVRLLDDDGRLAPLATTNERVEMLGEPPTYDPGDDAPPAIALRTESMLAYQNGEVDNDDRQDRRALEAAVYLPLGDHGTLSVATAESASIPEADRTLIEILAANTTVALDRLEQERRARERERQLERQNERLEEFASAVSHDLRSPLSVARGRLQLVTDGDDKDDESLDEIAKAHQQMDALIDDLLTLARQGRVLGETTASDLEEIAHTAWGTADTAEAVLEVDDPGMVEADPDRLIQLLTNLFRNAVEHGGSDVTVEVDSLAGGGFYVADDGPGVPADRRDQIFERGYTTEHDGTGFGLAIVEEIVDAHGWDIRVVESDTGGARFEITGVDVV